MKQKTFAPLALFIVFVYLGVTGAIFVTSCGKQPNIQTNPVGAVAVYGLRVIDTVKAVQEVVITAEAAKLIPTDKAWAVIMVTRQLGVKAQELADGLTSLNQVTGNDISQAARLAKIGIILRAMNDLVLQVIVPIDDAGVREKVSIVLTQVSALLITISGQLGV